MGKPDFIGIGTERAGTSWVFSMIAHHPQSWVPPLKELHFLDAIDPDVPSHYPRYKWHLTSRLKQKAAPLLKKEERPEFYKNSFAEYLLWDAYYFTGKQDFEWYQRLFAERFTNGRICGEYTPAYCNIAPSYIRELLHINSQMKFILMIREPKEQMRSSLIQHFKMIKGRDFKAVSEEEMLAWLNSDFAKKKSNLSDILNKWSAEVPKEQLFIGFYGEIRDHAGPFINRLYSFLGLDTGFMPEKRFYERKINTLTKPDYQIPKSVQSVISERCAPEIQYIQSHHPELSTYRGE